jgi:hypothetical protein
MCFTSLRLTLTAKVPKLNNVKRKEEYHEELS